MAAPESPQPAKLIVAVMASREEFLERAQAELESFHGPIDALSPLIPVRDNHYYENEMGRGLAKRIVAFEKLIDPGELASVKIHTISMEQSFSVGGQRVINLDPGYLTIGSLVLASAKPRSKRIYLRDGIYAELELIYQNGRFKRLPWTYPDYRQPPILPFLEEVREAYLRQLREGNVQGNA